jgi:hypothetical protein
MAMIDDATSRLFARFVRHDSSEEHAGREDWPLYTAGGNELGHTLFRLRSPSGRPLQWSVRN